MFRSFNWYNPISLLSRTTIPEGHQMNGPWYGHTIQLKSVCARAGRRRSVSAANETFAFARARWTCLRIIFGVSTSPDSLKCLPLKKICLHLPSGCEWAIQTYWFSAAERWIRCQKCGTASSAPTYLLDARHGCRCHAYDSRQDSTQFQMQTYLIGDFGTVCTKIGRFERVQHFPLAVRAVHNRSTPPVVGTVEWSTESINVPKKKHIDA